MSETRKDRAWNRCDYCGRFIPLADLESGAASRRLVAPDSEHTAERYETRCQEHKTPEWMIAMEPFERIEQARYRATREIVNALTTEEVEQLLAHAESGPSTTNCGWQMYEAAKWLKRELRWELQHRKTTPDAEEVPHA